MGKMADHADIGLKRQLFLGDRFYKCLSWYASILGGLLLAFLLTLALVSNRPMTSALETNMGIRAINPSIALYADGQSGSNNYIADIRPTSMGVVSSVQTNIRVVTTDTIGYELYLQANGANMVGQHANLSPIAGGSATITSPTAFTTATCNSWGFATPRDAGQPTTSGFDSSYAVVSNQSVNSHTSRYQPFSSNLRHRIFL